MNPQEVFLATLRRAAVVVAHPDDEIIWVVGLLLENPHWEVTVVSMCRASDPDRSRRFRRVARELGVTGLMADLPDDPDQTPLEACDVESGVMSKIGGRSFDLLLSHNPVGGEYTRHRRHEEVGMAVARLWCFRRLTARALWMFAFEDGEGAYIPHPRADAHFHLSCGESTAKEKRRLITGVYGFSPSGFEAHAAGKHEAFFCWSSAEELMKWLSPVLQKDPEEGNESAGSL